MPTWLALIGAYVVGSVDFAILVARLRGVDIRTVGSGNPGTSNVLRTLGKGAAAMVLVGDAFKGVIAASFGLLAAGAGAAEAGTDLLAIDEPLMWAAGFCAVVGHVFPLFHGFKGGKGVATAAGVALFGMPVAALALVVVWVLIAKFGKVASIASLTVVVLGVPAALVSGVSGWSLGWLAAILGLIVVRHLPNIRRMMSGSEEKVQV